MNKTDLDATEFKQRGGALSAKIADEVKKTQMFIQKELPNTLYITQAQFDSLMNTLNQTSYMSATQELPSSIYKGKVEKAYIFYTPYNAMDVVVVDKPDKQILV